MNTDSKRPTDSFSQTVEQLNSNPAAIKVKPAIVDATDFYGNVVRWVVQTIRGEAGDSVLLERVDAATPLREVLPPKVVAMINRQQEAVAGVVRKRAAGRAADTRRAKKGGNRGD